MNKPFKSFGYSLSGIAYAFKTQWNFRFHIAALFLVLLSGCFFGLHLNEWLWITAAAGWVLVAELFNTAIEVLVDLISPDVHPKAKIIKDTAAGAVLLSALAALVIGLVIFIPKILKYAA